jgi:molybdate-binding protein
MGSTAALQALQRGEVHVAGIHLTDDSTGESNLPFLRRHLKASAYEVITFATWEEGLVVRPGNPKQIRSVADLVRDDVTVINREEGAGARLLLDQRLRAAGLVGSRVKGYERTAASHLHVARLVAEGQADAGVGIRSASQSYGLEFIPLQSARYDLVVPKAYLSSHPSLNHLFDTLASRPFRSEIAAIGGYDTTDTEASGVVRMQILVDRLMSGAGWCLLACLSVLPMPFSPEMHCDSHAGDCCLAASPFPSKEPTV